MVTTESPASRDSPITLNRKQTGKPIAGNRHDGFEVAGAGTQLTVRLLRPSQRKRGATARRNLRSMAPALDPTRLTWLTYSIPKSRLSCLESGGREGIRTPGLLVANEEKSKLRCGAT